MKRNVLLGVSLGIILLSVGLFFLRPNPSKPDSPAVETSNANVKKGDNAQKSVSPVPPVEILTNSSSSKPDDISTAPATAKLTQKAAPAAAVQTFEPEITNMTPATALEIVRSVIRNYGQRFGGNPVGTNPEITRALAGQNPGQVNFLGAEESLRVNRKGELIDVWGTPYFFHQLSGTEMEIHSAGPDKIMWTSDDLVLK